MSQVNSSFSYDLAFSRNIGWLTREEQQKLRGCTVAIAGCGGVGGHYCESMARLGVGKFKIADFDQFEVQNFNRQNGARMPNVGKNKVDVAKDNIITINPEAEVTIFDRGINDENIEEFIDGVDIYLDGLDFFVIEVREKLFKALGDKGIPAITVAPIGLGAAMIAFDKNSMSFEDYFGLWTVNSNSEKALLFSLGLGPSGMHGKYIADWSSFDFHNQKVPSCTAGVYLAAGVMVTNVLKVLIGRGKVYKAPYSIHFDAFNNKLIRKRIHFGYKNPFQRVKYYFAKRMFGLD